MAFRDGLRRTLRRNLVGAYLYGSIAFPGYVPASGDIDFYVVVRHSPRAAERRDLERLHGDLAKRFRHGARLDGLYIAVTKARDPGRPRGLVYAAEGAFRTGGTDYEWAFHRAHLRRGACIVLHGPPPRRLFARVTPGELRRQLDRELKESTQALRRYPMYAILNLCRLVYSWRIGDIVVSKREASRWALTELPGRWRPVVRAARTAYKGGTGRATRERLWRDGRGFARFVREEIRTARRARQLT